MLSIGDNTGVRLVGNKIGVYSQVGGYTVTGLCSVTDITGVRLVKNTGVY